MLTAVPLGLGSNPGEDMDVCNCIVPFVAGGTLNSRRAAKPLARLVEGKERAMLYAEHLTISKGFISDSSDRSGL
ncbi:hypothetical protein TNCV_2115241 [Trichonephila clavipes]|nr:hypothetical protein TNCV_2115241 [Trichonephila clavipes]